MIREASWRSFSPDGKVLQRTLPEDELRARVVAVAGSSTDRAVETYHRLFPAATPAERLISILSDANFRLPSITLAERKAAQARNEAVLSHSIRATDDRFSQN